ncbi:UNVERIFIED_CONTAM: hypothetical protein K2H54_016353 [Gekko kuhli]
MRASVLQKAEQRDVQEEVLPEFGASHVRICPLGVLLREEVSQLQEEVHLLRQMKEMLTKDLEETHGSKSTEILSATELKVQLAQKEQELARAKEALQGCFSAVRVPASLPMKSPYGDGDLAYGIASTV